MSNGFGFNKINKTEKIDDTVNFFINNTNESPLFVRSETAKRLNDYDYNILKEDAYRDISDELFKIEYKIAKIEEELKSLDIQIQSSRDISDYDTIEFLSNRKKQLKEELILLTDIYKQKSVSARISGGIFNMLSPKIKDYVNKYNKFITEIKSLIIANLPNNISSILEIKQSLKKLENINKNVDELMTMQTPYGEAGEKYVQLSKYITRANAIQAKIAKTIRQ